MKPIEVWHEGARDRPCQDNGGHPTGLPEVRAALVDGETLNFYGLIFERPLERCTQRRHTFLAVGPIRRQICLGARWAPEQSVVSKTSAG